MPLLAQVCVKLTAAELEMIKPGLQLLIDGLADGHRGLFPHRRRWDRIDLEYTNVHRGKVYDPTMSRLLFDLHHELGHPAYVFSWTPIQLAAAQLALRLYSRGSSLAADKQNQGALGRKLECLRKRAKRRCMGQEDGDAYKEASATWQRFVAWLRYHLLQTQPPDCQVAGLRAVWLRQRAILTALMTDAIRERCFHPLPAEEIHHLVTLVKAELRRGRHRLTLKGVLDNPAAGKEVLFEFVQQRHRWLVPAQGAKLSVMRQAMLVEARMVAAGRGRYTVDPASTDPEMEQWIAAALRSYTLPLSPPA